MKYKIVSGNNVYEGIIENDGSHFSFKTRIGQISEEEFIAFLKTKLSHKRPSIAGRMRHPDSKNLLPGLRTKDKNFHFCLYKGEGTKLNPYVSMIDDSKNVFVETLRELAKQNHEFLVWGEFNSELIYVFMNKGMGTKTDPIIYPASTFQQRYWSTVKDHLGEAAKEIGEPILFARSGDNWTWGANWGNKEGADKRYLYIPEEVPVYDFIRKIKDILRKAFFTSEHPLVSVNITGNDGISSSEITMHDGNGTKKTPYISFEGEELDNFQKTLYLYGVKNDQDDFVYGLFNGKLIVRYDAQQVGSKDDPIILYYGQGVQELHRLANESGEKVYGSVRDEYLTQKHDKYIAGIESKESEPTTILEFKPK